MRATKYILVAASVVVVLAMAVWFLRDTLIERISNPLLREYGFTVTYVSLDALATDDASIGYLELLHDNGTTISIRDLKLPIGRSATRSNIYKARSVSVVMPADTDAEPFETALLIDRLLTLPDNLGSNEVLVDEFSLAPYPTIGSLHWVLTKGEQTIRATVASIAMSATITTIDATNHGVVFSLPNELMPAQEHSVTANLQQGGQGITLTGSAALDLPAWEAIAKLSRILPDEVDFQSGTAALRFAVEIPDDAAQSPTISADFAPSSPWQLTYSSSPDEIAAIVVETGSPVIVSATFPEVTWSLQQAQSSLRVSYGEWQKIPLVISGLACHQDPACSMNTRVTMADARLPVGKVSRIEFASAIDVFFPGGGVYADVKPGATLKIAGWSTAETRVGRVDARLASPARLDLVDAGWRFAADSLDAKIEGMSVAEDITVTMPLFFENIVSSELDTVFVAKSTIYASSSQAGWNGQNIGLPGFKGNASLQGKNAAVDLKTVGLYRNGTLKARHNLDNATGRLSLAGAAVSLSAQKLSKRVAPWRKDWDLIAGTVAVDLDAGWEQKKSSYLLSADSDIAVSDIAGYYTDTAFTGLSTQLKLAYREPNGLAAEPSNISVALLDMGFPVENLSAMYTLDLDARSADIDNLRMTAFGGTVSADPFSFRTAADSNTLILHAESIDLTELLSLQDFEAIEVRGRIGASLPVTIAADTITIVGGTLTGEEPGGVIRYRPAKPPDKKDMSGIAVATRALSNFEFKTLTSDVNLSDDGDLDLKLQLTGRNPDLDEKRPVVLNLGVEDNIPQMLRSLQAARAVEDILAKRLKK
ncbi:MAG: YdbH domain-containing protein [Gammaproteobacteria bacterium]|nr:YdbH domain-containing protein [Gammaproteobacteria bacterium]MBT8111919.1 YdbH domain-containing protein [Gammaproteobacteria bacterium]NND47938.1 YdbH domain-containing protein [Woeseiaceae bacterium]NNL46618.1 YdbH domain-containing protein [Woeseiaceae bacterium]